MAATGTNHGTIGPAQSLDELIATVSIREVADGLNEGIWQVWRVLLHVNIIPNGCDIYSLEPQRGPGLCSEKWEITGARVGIGSAVSLWA